MLRLWRCAFIFLIPLFVFAFHSSSFAVGSEQVLYAFTGGADGATPSSGLTMDAYGNLYGTTSGGGILGDCNGYLRAGCGVVYELTRSGSGWQETVIYAFESQFDGEEPSGNLVFDASGNLYGTTVYGGNNPTVYCRQGCGTVFELSPNGDGTWSKTTIYTFHGHEDGESPYGLTIDATGNLYGLTEYGGTGGGGVAYKLSPPAQKGESWTEQIIYDFAYFETELNPGLTFDQQGNLYGTYYQLYSCYPGCGAVFQLKPAQGTWTETDLFDFSGGGNGGEPMAGVILDNYGNLYGTAAEGGNNWGMAFELRPGRNPWTGIMLHNFCSTNNCADGATPEAGLVMDSTGALYGTTENGGGCIAYNCPGGTVFKLTRTQIKGVWKETVLYRFHNNPDGYSPAAALILDSQGNLYGTTLYGGDSYGTVFEVMQ